MCVAPLAPVPVTVTGYVPGVVVPPTVTVIVDEAPAVSVVGLNAIVTPDGCPLALSVTDCAAPFVTAVLIVDVPFEPCWMLRLVGLPRSRNRTRSRSARPWSCASHSPRCR